MKRIIAKWIYDLLNAESYFDRAIRDNGICDRVDDITKAIGYDNFNFVLTDKNVVRAISALKGENYVDTKKQADLNEAPLAERIHKIEEILEIEFVKESKRGYVKKSSPPPITQ